MNACDKRTGRHMEGLFENVGRARGIAIIILDLFDGMLEEKGIVVPDADRQGDDGEAALHGMTYASLENQITAILADYIDE